MAKTKKTTNKIKALPNGWVQGLPTTQQYGPWWLVHAGNQLYITRSQLLTIIRERVDVIDQHEKTIIDLNNTIHAMQKEMDINRKQRAASIGACSVKMPSTPNEVINGFLSDVHNMSSEDLLKVFEGIVPPMYREFKQRHDNCVSNAKYSGKMMTGAQDVITECKLMQS